MKTEQTMNTGSTTATVAAQGWKEVVMSNNVKAMREALEYVSNVLAKWRRDAPFGAWNEYGEAIDRCRAALTAPRRNCDVGTAEEQCERFDAYCCGRKCDNCPLQASSRCNLAWAQMPYTAENEVKR